MLDPSSGQANKSLNPLSDTELLKWCRQNTSGHDHITPAQDLYKCWEDGLCLCALLYTWFPEKVPISALMTPPETREDKINNLQLAFTVAEDAGIEPFLDAKQIVDSSLENGIFAKEIIHYLNKIYENLGSRPTRFQASQAWLKKFEEDEKVRKLNEIKQRNYLMGNFNNLTDAEKKTLLSSKDSQFTGALLSMKAGDLQSRLEAKKLEDAHLEKQEENRLRERAKALIFENSHPDEDYEIQQAREKARKKIRLAQEEEKEREKRREEERVIAQDEQDKKDSYNASAIDYTVTVKGGSTGIVAKFCLFSVNFTVGGKKPVNSDKNDLVCYMDGPSKKSKLMISGGVGGTFHIGYTPDHPGQHWFDFVYKNIWTNGPYCLRVLGTQDYCPDYPYIGKERRAYEGVEVDIENKENEISGEPQEIEKTDQDKEKEKEKMQLQMRIVELDKEIQAMQEIKPSEYEELRNQAIVDSREKLYAKLDFITYTFRESDGSALLGINSAGGNSSKFTIVLNGVELIEPDIIDHQDGTYSTTQIVIENENLIEIKYEEKTLAGFPIRFYQPKDSISEANENQYNMLVKELKARKEKEVEPLKKELVNLIQKKRENKAKTHRRKSSKLEKVDMWEQFAAKNKESSSSELQVPDRINRNSGSNPNKLSLGPWGQKNQKT